MGSKTMQNHAKTARKISKTDFYFVTCFYSLRDICIADGIRHPNVELGVVTRCLITDKLQFICESICYIRQGFNKNLSPPAAYGRVLCTNKRLYIRSYENKFSTT